MNHKSVIRALAALFCVGIGASMLMFFVSLPLNPGFVFVAIFVSLIISCIIFFKTEDRVKAENKRAGYVKVIGQNMIISKKRTVSRKNLFLRVSIIALLGSVFGKKN